MPTRKTYPTLWDAVGDIQAQAANLTARAKLMGQIIYAINPNGCTPAKAATNCGLAHTRANDPLKGRVQRFALDALATTLAHITPDPVLQPTNPQKPPPRVCG